MHGHNLRLWTTSLHGSRSTADKIRRRAPRTHSRCFIFASTAPAERIFFAPLGRLRWPTTVFGWTAEVESDLSKCQRTHSGRENVRGCDFASPGASLWHSLHCHNPRYMRWEIAFNVNTGGRVLWAIWLMVDCNTIHHGPFRIIDAGR